MQEKGGGSEFPAGAGPPPSELGKATATPISVRLPLADPSAAAGNGFDEEIVGERESGCGSPPAGNRWPRQETMALLKIRSDMDPLFREATLKAPLWEELSRKLAEEGRYQRSAKKCKEKFENVFKYYKRTKEARAGKSYRFFSQLEALRSSSSSSAAATALPPPIVSSSSGAMVNIEASSSAAAAAAAAPSQHPLFSATVPPPRPIDAADGPSSSSNTSSYSGTESEGEGEGEGEEEGGGGGRKRKRELGGGEAPDDGGKISMMAFLEGIIQQVMDQQEAMLERFLEAIERREQNRMIREEAWRRQEKARLSREHELAAQERAAATSRDDAIISFLQKLIGQEIPIPPPPQPPPPPPPPPPPQSAAEFEETPTPTPPPPQDYPDDRPPKVTALGSSSRTTATIEPILSSRWPKSEVHALIELRSGMESMYQESIPKGPLWEEISAGMRRLGYNRSAKRCKEKWENINKYFKKVKETSNKSRPEDAKTCPYFHQLDALYRTKRFGGVGSSSAGTVAQNLSTDDDHLAIISSTSKQQDDSLSFFEQGSSSISPLKKPEDIVKKKNKKMMMEQAIVEPETESDIKEKGSSFQFRIQYRMPSVVSGGTGQNNLSAMVR